LLCKQKREYDEDQRSERGEGNSSTSSAIRGKKVKTKKKPSEGNGLDSTWFPGFPREDRRKAWGGKRGCGGLPWGNSGVWPLGTSPTRLLTGKSKGGKDERKKKLTGREGKKKRGDKRREGA